MESIIAAVVITIVGAVVSWGLQRVGKKQDQAAAALEATFAQFKRDIDALAGALNMHRMSDGNLYRNARARRR